MKRCVFVIGFAMVGGGAASGFSGTPNGANAGNGWMDTLSLPGIGSTSTQPFRFFATTPGDGINHMRESRVFFRLPEQTREWNHGPGSTTDGFVVTGGFVGTLDGTLDTGGLNFTITAPTGSPVFTSQQRWTISEGALGPSVRFKETVTNTSPVDRVYHSYHYFAPALDNQGSNSVAPGRDFGKYIVEGPQSAMRLDAYSDTRGSAATLQGAYISTDGSARTMMMNGVVNDLVGETFSGAASGTVQIVLQWRLELAPGESAEFGYEFAFVPAPSGAALMTLLLAALPTRRRR